MSSITSGGERENMLTSSPFSSSFSMPPRATAPTLSDLYPRANRAHAIFTAVHKHGVDLLRPNRTVTSCSQRQFHRQTRRNSGAQGPQEGPSCPCQSAQRSSDAGSIAGRGITCVPHGNACETWMMSMCHNCDHWKVKLSLLYLAEE